MLTPEERKRLHEQNIGEALVQCESVIGRLTEREITILRVGFNLGVIEGMATSAASWAEAVRESTKLLPTKGNHA